MNSFTTIKLLLILSVSILFTNFSYSQWQQTNGIKGGTINKIAGSSNNLLAIASYNSIFHFENEEWDLRNSLSTYENIFKLYESWIGTSINTISRSDDNGENWQKLLEPGESNLFISSKVIGESIYAMTADSFFASNDLGNTWQINQINQWVYDNNSGQKDSGFIYGLSNFYVKDKILIATAFTTLLNHFDAVLYSTDFGQNWRISNFPLDFNTFNTTFTADENFIYAAIPDGFFKSGNGLDWTEINDGLPYEGESIYIRDMKIFNGDLLASIGTQPSGLYKFNGTNWNIFYDETAPNSLSIESNELVICTNNDIKKYNGNNEWSSLTKNLIATTSKPVASENGSVFSLYKNKIYRTTDKGNTWNEILDNAGIIAVNNESVFTLTNSGILRSLNMGDDWELVNNGIPSNYISKLSALGSTNNLRIAGFYGSSAPGFWSQGGTYISTDNGNSWTAFNNGLPKISGVPAPVYSMIAKNDIAVIYTTEGRYSLVDNGWINLTSDFPPERYIFNVYIFKDKLLIVTNDGYYISDDKGGTKEQINSGLPAEWYFLYSRFFTYNDELYLFLYTENENVYKLNNNEWEKVDFLLPEKIRFSDFETTGRTIYAGTYDNGIWKYEETSTANNDGFQNIFSYELKQNYPNPFNPSTTIKFSIADDGSFVELKVFDILGKEVKTLLSENKSAGNYELSFNASSLPSGVYFYRINAGNYTSTKKMLLLK